MRELYPGRAIKLSLSAAIAVAMGISALRVLTGMSILWFLVPGYIIAIVLSFFVPDIYIRPLPLTPAALRPAP